MILTHEGIEALINCGVVQGSRRGAVNGTSLDVHLSDMWIVERKGRADDLPTIVDLVKREGIRTRAFSNHEFHLMPGQFILAATEEVFNLPLNISADFKLKSSVARNGLQHAIACWCDPGWRGSRLTLELHNVTRYHTLRLKAGLPIGQMIFHQHTPVGEEYDYGRRGRYNNDAKPQEIKP